MGKKNIACTVDEVEDVRLRLVAQIEETRSRLESQYNTKIAELEQKLGSDVRAVQQGLEHLDKEKVGEESCERVAKQAEDELARCIAELRGEIEGLQPLVRDTAARTQADLEQKLARTDAGTREAFAQELESLCGHFDQQLGGLRESLEAMLAHNAQEAAHALAQEREKIDDAVNQARQAAFQAALEAQQAAVNELKRVVEAQEMVDKKQDMKAKTVQSDNEERFAELERQLKEATDQGAKALAKAVAAASASLAAANADRDKRFDGVDGRIDRLDAVFADVENVPTRRVDWIIREAERRLKVPPPAEEGGAPPEYGAWLSPVFDAAGARGLRLELRVFRPLDPPAENQDKGDCVAILHAPKGTHVAFRLSIGSASETFEHRFGPGQDVVSTQRMCFLVEQISTVTGALKVTIEVMECLFETEKKIVPVEEEDGPPPLESSFKMQRHVNNRILDQVKAQMEYLKKRMTRRIEWRLEQASVMRKNFPKGAPIRSKEFDAAGVEGLQFWFYPSGYDTAGEGFVSLFLCAPAGTTISCFMQVGAERRDINHTFEKTGQIGKAHFCRWESCFDPDEDAVLIVLDIQEAHVELAAKMSHPPPPAAGIRSLTRESTPLVPVGSIIKLQRVADHLPPILQEVKVLPPHWASKNYDTAVKVDGFRPLKDVRGRAGPRGGGPRKSPSSPLLPLQ